MTEKIKTSLETENLSVDTQSLGEMTVLASKLEEISIKEKREDVKHWSDEYKDIEQTFAKKEIKNAKEFEIWEDDAKHAFDKMKDAELYSDFQDRYERDAFEKLSKCDPSETIEAKSGQYYRERNEAIIEAIKQNPNNEEKESELKTVHGLHMLVAGHIQAIMDYEARGSSPEAYNAHRKNAHNSLISGINKINHIAEKYGTKRLIYRDFETNDFLYDKSKDAYGETNARAEYDRSIVEAYTRYAFSRDYEQAEKENNITTNRDSIISMFHGEDF